MITPELENYIKQSRAQGMPDAQIRQNLIAGGGWSESDLNQAFGGFQPATPVPMNATPASAATVTSHLGLILGIVGILILAGGGFFGYQYFNKSPSENVTVYDEPSLEDTDKTVADNSTNSSTETTTADPTKLSYSNINKADLVLIPPGKCRVDELSVYLGAKEAEGADKGFAMLSACGKVYTTSDSPQAVEDFYLSESSYMLPIGYFEEMVGPYKSYYQIFNNLSAANPRQDDNGDYQAHITLIALSREKIAFIQIASVAIIKSNFQIYGKDYPNNTRTEILIMEKKKEF